MLYLVEVNIKSGMSMLIEEAKQIAIDFGEEPMKEKKINMDPLREIAKFREKCDQAKELLEKERKKAERLERVRMKEKQRKAAFRKNPTNAVPFSNLGF